MNQESRLTEIAAALFRMASLDFSRSLEASGDGTVMDGVIGGINMLAEELQAHLVEREQAALELEERVRARTAELEASMARWKALEIELRQAHKLEAVGRLAAGIAHEINTPIQFIGDNLMFLGDSLAALSSVFEMRSALLTPLQLEASHRLEEQLDFAYLATEVPTAIEQSVAGIEQIAKIVRAMKMFSHEEPSGTQRPVDLRATLDAVVTVARSETRDLADVVVEIDGMPNVIAFGSELNQVFLNLIVNAAHAIKDVATKTDKRGVIHIRAKRDASHVVVMVEDNGTGIPEAIREQVFVPFFTTKDVGDGSGQGLALARAVILRHGGTLTFESEMGRGTTFFVRLPIEGKSYERSAA